MPKVDRPGNLGHHRHILRRGEHTILSICVLAPAHMLHKLTALLSCAAGCGHQAGLRHQAHMEQKFCFTRRNVRAPAALRDNPQNVPDPEVNQIALPGMTAAYRLMYHNPDAREYRAVRHA